LKLFGKSKVIPKEKVYVKNATRPCVVAYTSNLSSQEADTG
jgi:hypothetical protein